MARTGTDIHRQVIVGIEATAPEGPGPEAERRVLAPVAQQLMAYLQAFKVFTVNLFGMPSAEPGKAKGVVVLQIQDGSVSDLLAMEKPAYVKYWEPNGPMVLCAWDDEHFLNDQWGLRRIGTLETWNTMITTAVTVAIIDSGVMWRWDPDADKVVGVHQDLDERANGPQFPSRFWRSGENPPADGADEDASGADDDFNGARLIETDRDGLISDDNGHGTNLAGIIFASPGNHIGIASPIGPYWPNIRMMPIKFFDADSRPSPDNAAQAILYAVKNGARIVNASWHVGPGQEGLTVVTEAIAEAQAKGVLVVAAVGNDGSDNDEYPTYPANLSLAFDNVLAVHATNREDDKTSFSNFGKTSVHLGAPGVEIMTTARYLEDLNFAYQPVRGTSASAAFVSLAAALVIAVDKQRNPGRDLTPAQVIAHLTDTADTFPQLTICSISGGRLNLEKAVTTLVP
jgi:subtilisin family serine protease